MLHISNWGQTNVVSFWESQQDTSLRCTKHRYISREWSYKHRFTCTYGRTWDWGHCVAVHHSPSCCNRPLNSRHPCYNGQLWLFHHNFSTLELNHWKGETPLLYITDTFHTPNCMQTMHNDPNLVDTHWPFQQDYPPSLWELTSTATHSTSFCLAFSVNLQQRNSRKTYIHIVLNSSSTYTTPTRNIPGARILC